MTSRDVSADDSLFTGFLRFDFELLFSFSEIKLKLIDSWDRTGWPFIVLFKAFSLGAAWTVESTDEELEPGRCCWEFNIFGDEVCADDILDGLEFSLIVLEVSLVVKDSCLSRSSFEISCFFWAL